MMRRDVTDYRNLRRHADQPSHARSTWLAAQTWGALLICAAGIVLCSAGGAALLDMLAIHGPTGGYAWLLIPGLACWFGGGILGHRALDRLER